jgi:hypothetical protein
MGFYERQLLRICVEERTVRRRPYISHGAEASAASGCILCEKCTSQGTDKVAHTTKPDSLRMFRRNSAVLTLVFHGLLQPFDMLAAEHPDQGVKFCGSLLKPDKRFLGNLETL